MKIIIFLLSCFEECEFGSLRVLTFRCFFLFFSTCTRIPEVLLLFVSCSSNETSGVAVAACQKDKKIGNLLCVAQLTRSMSVASAKASNCVVYGKQCGKYTQIRNKSE